MIAAQQNYYSDNLPNWFTEKHDIKEADKKENERLNNVRKDNEIENQKQIKRFEKISMEEKIFSDDLIISQNVLQIMRRSGMIPAVNAGEKDKVFPDPVKTIEKEYLELRLRKDVDFRDWKNGKRNKNQNQNPNTPNTTEFKNKKNVKFAENNKKDSNDINEIENEDFDRDDLIFLPFNVDLSVGSAKVTYLQCYLIGEKGN